MEVLGIKEVAELLRVPVSQVYVLVRQKDFPAFRVGKHWRIPKEKLNAWIMEQTQKPK